MSSIYETILSKVGYSDNSTDLPLVRVIALEISLEHQYFLNTVLLTPIVYHHDAGSNCEPQVNVRSRDITR
jgi:hypothetical protein